MHRGEPTIRLSGNRFVHAKARRGSWRVYAKEFDLTLFGMWRDVVHELGKRHDPESNDGGLVRSFHGRPSLCDAGRWLLFHVPLHHGQLRERGARR